MKNLIAAALAAGCLGTAPLSCAGRAAAADDTVITFSGTTFTPAPPLDPATLYGGAFVNDTQVDVAYPASLWPFTPTEPTLGQSVQIGVGMLNTDLSSTSGPTQVLGWSQGAMVIDAEQRALVNQPTKPGLTFVVAGDPTRPGGILSYLPAGTYIPILNYTTGPVPQSQYNTTVLTIEYDGIADFPDRPWNVVADANAVLGAFYLHPQEGQSIPTSGGVTTVNANGGTTTTYLEPAPYLPLTQPLTQIGVPAPVVNRIDKVLTPIIDAGYSRNDNPNAVVTAPYLKPGGQIQPPTINLPKATSPKAHTANAVRPSAHTQHHTGDHTPRHGKGRH